MTSAQTPVDPTPLVSIVIPAWNKWEFTFQCLLSLVEQTRGIPFETIVVDNGSTDETRVALPQLPGLRVLRNEQNLGFAKACNQGAAAARGKYLLMLNNDTEARPGWLPPLVRTIESDPRIGAVGCKLLYPAPEGTIQHAGVAVAYAAPHPIFPFHLHHRRPSEESTTPRDLTVVTAACMLVRADLFRELGGFDEGYVNGYEDVDLCFQIRDRGYRIVYTPESVLVHHESVSDGRFAKARENVERLHERWLGKFTAFDVDRRAGRQPVPPRRGRPRTSVVVPTCDAIGFVAALAEDLLPALAPGDELLFADTGSRDPTPRFLAQLAAEHPGVVRVLAVGRDAGLPGAARAALAEARGPMGVLCHSGHAGGSSLLNDVAAALAPRPGAALLALSIGEPGFWLGGPVANLGALLESAPEVTFRPDRAALQAAVARLGRGEAIAP